MATLTIGAEGLLSHVSIIFVPRSDGVSGTFSTFLPSDLVRLTTNKDDDAARKFDYWRNQGFSVVSVNVPRGVLQTTQMRQAVAEGEDWRIFIHEAAHEYYSNIEGPQRMRESIRQLGAAPFRAE